MLESPNNSDLPATLHPFTDGAEPQGQRTTAGVSFPDSQLITDYFPAKVIADATGWDKKTIQRTAKKEQWPQRIHGNRIDFAPPATIAQQCAALSARCPNGSSEGQGDVVPPSVTFSSLTHDGDQRAKALLRQQAVAFFKEKTSPPLSMGIERALSAAVTHIYHLAEEKGISNFAASTRTLREWIRNYDRHGLNGLVEQKQGRVGRKSIISRLTPKEQNDFLERSGKAMGLEYGSGGATNIARAARELATHPDLPAPLREHLHGAHASKSHVPSSIRAAMKAAPSTAELAQMGPRGARLSSGRWTPGDYTLVKAGQRFCSDDMTDNVVTWCEWPNTQGFRIGQAQLLPILDYGSIRFLNFRLIMRENGQYNSDDCAGVFGDVFDAFGLPDDGVLLEGGIWQGNKMRGHRTGIADEDRVGGLESLGLHIARAYGPTGKAVIEQSFNELQKSGDRCPGFIGREQRYDVNERVQKQVNLCKTGQAHQREFFMHLSQRANHLQEVMEKWNNERNDGKILRGRSPLEKWAEDAPQLRVIPDQSKWLYRSAMSLVQVTRNGVRVTQGTGAKMLVHYYDNPELLVPRTGQKVVVYWNDHNPETDAVLLSAQAPRKFLGTAAYVQPLARFGATEEQLTAEAARKKAAANYSRTELRSVQPELQRPRAPIATDMQANRIGDQIAQAESRLEEKNRVTKQTAAEVRRVQVSDSDLSSVLQDPSDQSDPTDSTRVTQEDINSLFD
jgi:hypothetical protein